MSDAAPGIKEPKARGVSLLLSRVFRLVKGNDLSVRNAVIEICRLWKLGIVELDSNLKCLPVLRVKGLEKGPRNPVVTYVMCNRRPAKNIFISVCLFCDF